MPYSRKSRPRYFNLPLPCDLHAELSQDYERTRQIYQTVVKLVPHKIFTFAKLWLLFARFEVRRLDLPAARKILGAGIGMCPKEALFKGYIQLELDVRLTVPQVHSRSSSTPFMKQLREFDRVRIIYEKYIEWDPSNSSAWIKFAELESQLEDFPRTRGIFELGISQASISMPELLWKAYIDFETEEGEREKARSLYERLIKLSGHVKVWISYALFEGEGIPVPRAEREDEDEDEEEVKMVEGDPELARQVFKRGYEDLRNKGLKSEVFTTTSPSTFVLKFVFTLSLARCGSRSLENLRRKARDPSRRRQGTRNVPHRLPQACLRPRDGHARRGLGDGVQGRREGIKPDEFQVLADGSGLESEGKEGAAHSPRRQW